MKTWELAVQFFVKLLGLGLPVLVLLGCSVDGTSEQASSSNAPFDTPPASFETLYDRSGALTNNQMALPQFNVSNVTDGDLSSAYSSNGFPTTKNSNGTHLAVYTSALRSVNEIVLLARNYAGAANGFPARYNIYVTNPSNSDWIFQGNYSTQPDTQFKVRVPLAKEVSTWGVLIVPTELGKDVFGGIYFQLAEVWLGKAYGKIGVRTTATGSEFYSKLTGKRFIPRGSTYVHFSNGLEYTFNVGSYSTANAAASLEEMKNNGYNTVRIGMNYEELGRDANGNVLSHPGLNPQYMANVIEFLSLARMRGIYVIIAATWVPPNYGSIAYSLPLPQNVEGFNSIFMSPGYILALQTYWRDLVTAIKASDPSLIGAVFGLDVWTEAGFAWAEKPFSMTSGTVTPAEGGTYDMADASSRQLAADRSAIYWEQKMISAIRAVDPEVMITTSVYSPLAVGYNGYDGVSPGAHPGVVAPFRVKALNQTGISYIDIHAYTDPAHTLAQTLTVAEFGQLDNSKPRFMGEFGAYKPYYTDIVQGAFALRDHQVASCAFGFQGWLLWTWDDSSQDFYTMVEQGGAVNGVLSPLARPDACTP